MRTKKTLRVDEQSDRELEKAISKFSQHLMSNSKWIRLVDKLVEHADHILKIHVKKVQQDQIGEVYIDKDTTYEWDYWWGGFEGQNSFRGWLLYKEIEYLIFPKIVDSDKQIEQDLELIEAVLKSVGQFDLDVTENSIKLICYKE